MIVTELTTVIHHRYLKVFSKIKEYLKNNSFGQFYFDVCYDQIDLQTDFDGCYDCNDSSNYEVLPFSMLYGLLECFFEENGIEIEIRNVIMYYEFQLFSTKTNDFVHESTDDFKSKNDAKYNAILKACEILERKL
jgi:hypothetical protein